MVWLNIYIFSVLVLVLIAQFFYRFSSGRWAVFSNKSSTFLILRKKVLDKFKFKIFLRWVWILSTVLIFATFFYWSELQYRLWSTGGDFGKFFLPPYQSIGYFLSYVGVRFLGPWILAFLASLIVSRVAKYLNRKFGERFFENEEIELIALGVFLTGYPGFFIYLSLLLIFYLFLQVLNNIRVVFLNQRLAHVSKEPQTDAEIHADQRGKLLRESAFSQRLSAYYLWMSMAVFAIIIRDWLIPALGWQALLSGFSLGDFYKLFFGS